MTTFQILDSFAQDLLIQNETETTREVAFVDGGLSDGDDEVIDRRKRAKTNGTVTARAPRRMVIHLFGSCPDGRNIRINVEGFEPFFFVRLPSQSSLTDFQMKLEGEIAAKKDTLLAGDELTITLCKRKVLFGYTGGAVYPFVKLSVKSIQAFRVLKNYFVSKENRPIFRLKSDLLEVYEANLDPMLRFFHLRNLQPCGWVTIDDTAEIGENGILETDIDWESIHPCAKPPVPVAPFLLASWDIECYSENKEFPIPKRSYERIAKLLLAMPEEETEPIEVLTQAALYPENPPKGMDPMRHRNGKLPTRATLEPLFAKFAPELTGLLENRTGLTVVQRDLRVKKIQDLLKKSLDRSFPLAGDPVIQIGVVLQRGTAKPEKHVFVFGSCDPVDDSVVHAYKTEKEMIIGWAKAMRTWNPDMLVGYNVFGFDEKYLWTRVEELGIADHDALQAFSRLQDRNKEVVLEEKFLSSSALGDNTMYILTCHGRLQVDLYQYIKRSFSLQSYKLDDVCQHFMSGKLSHIECGPTEWSIKTKSTKDVVVGRYIVLLDETGDAVVDKLKVVAITEAGLQVEAPQGDDAPELEIAAANAMKWAVVKDDVSPQEIFKLHNEGGAAGRSRVAAYCIQDCVLVLDLYKKLEVFNNAMAMANACSVPVGYIFTRGQGVKIESLIFKECYQREQCIQVLPNPAEGGQEESYEGAIVLDPTPGFYFESPIGVADFASLYPSTIISENISYDTLIWVKNYSLDGTFLGFAFGSDAEVGPDVRFTDISFDIWGVKEGDTRKAPEKVKRGLRICRYAQLPGDVKGTLPQIVQALLATRKAKRKEGAAETDPFRKALLDAEQLAYKLTANSLYGQLGSSTFKIRLQHLAASVTAYGRKQILFAKDVIERFYGPAAADPRCEAQITYGDTDSLFVNFAAKNPTTGVLLQGKEAIEATMKLTEEAGKFVSRCLKSPHDFEYDKVFYPFIIFSKKRYVGNKYEESADDYYQNSMGIATKRRDYAGIVKVIYGGALRILLTDRDIQGSITFVKEKLLDLASGKMSMNLLTMSKSLRAEYKAETPPAHKILAQRIAERDPGNAPASGERVQFIYVLPQPGQLAPKLQGDRVETPTWIREKGLKIDYRFYVEHQLWNPLTQLFSLVIDKIPGVAVPAQGWTTATRTAATEEVLFKQVMAACDKQAVRSYGAKLFGLQPTIQAPAMDRMVPAPLSPIAAAAPLKQTKLNSFFIDSMILKAQATKAKRASKATGAALKSDP